VGSIENQQPRRKEMEHDCSTHEFTALPDSNPVVFFENLCHYSTLADTYKGSNKVEVVEVSEDDEEIWF
jgi:hypothetical protein